MALPATNGRTASVQWRGEAQKTLIRIKICKKNLYPLRGEAM